MARRKIRNYPSMEYIRNVIDNYFEENKNSVIDYLLNKTGYNTLESLQEDEYHGVFGFDCGLMYIEPLNPEWKREWILDNGKYDARIHPHKMPYNTQSTTLQSIMIHKALFDTCLNEYMYTTTWID